MGCAASQPAKESKRDRRRSRAASTAGREKRKKKSVAPHAATAPSKSQRSGAPSSIAGGSSVGGQKKNVKEQAREAPVADLASPTIAPAPKKLSDDGFRRFSELQSFAGTVGGMPNVVKTQQLDSSEETGRGDTKKIVAAHAHVPRADVGKADSKKLSGQSGSSKATQLVQKWLDQPMGAAAALLERDHRAAASSAAAELNVSAGDTLGIDVEGASTTTKNTTTTKTNRTGKPMLLRATSFSMTSADFAAAEHAGIGDRPDTTEVPVCLGAMPMHPDDTEKVAVNPLLAPAEDSRNDVSNTVTVTTNDIGQLPGTDDDRTA
jgi:hypothetical protein